MSQAKDMNVECYFLNWNEAETIRLTVNHYLKFCNKITVFDNHSDDGSDRIAQSMGCEVIKYGTVGELNDGYYRDIKNNCWKKSTADFVIVCDADEILYHRDIFAVLDFAKKQGTTIFKTQGWNMFSESMPVNDYTEIKTGVKADAYSKLVIFDPQAIREIGYVYGCHEAKPEGRIQFSEITLPLLHYRCIGGAQRLIDRHTLYEPRRSELNRRWQMGSYGYTLDPEKVEAKRREFSETLSRSLELPFL